MVSGDLEYNVMYAVALLCPYNVMYAVAGQSRIQRYVCRGRTI